MDKSPDALFRRMDPDYHYPTFGDDSTVAENAPTSGKFFVKLQKKETYGLWGNFKIGYTDNDLAMWTVDCTAPTCIISRWIPPLSANRAS